LAVNSILPTIETASWRPFPLLHLREKRDGTEASADWSGRVGS
jgi:hypothetical protein